MRFHLRCLLVSLALLLGGCTLVGAPAPVGPRGPASDAGPGPSRPPVAVAAPARDAEGIPASGYVIEQVVEIALESIGTPYVWGGTGANGFDCSGLIQYAYAQVGILLPRISRAQIGSGSPVPPDPRLLRPGDVLGFSESGARRTEHVGLYIGGGEFIHSSSSGVRISALGNAYWRERLVAARRMVD